ncbi:hypothetical protein ES705_44873 [subsurface metagenome]
MPQDIKVTEAINTIPKFDEDDLDPEIREVIIRLNASGFITAGSCAGHRDCPPSHGDRGFISFESVYSHAAIVAALTWYGLKNITVEAIHDIDCGDWTVARFDPVGKRISPWWIRHAAVCDGPELPQGERCPAAGGLRPGSPGRNDTQDFPTQGISAGGRARINDRWGHILKCELPQP